MIKSKDIKYVRECSGCTMQHSKAMAKLLDENGLDIYSNEAAELMQTYHFKEKAIRYSKWLEIKELIKEFGPIGD